jgi:uncharacterized protein YndB with AHSA1/START domain
MVMTVKLVCRAMLMVVLGSIVTSQAASIRKEIHIDVPPEAVWDAVSDFANVHKRLVPGFVTDLKMDGNARIVTFANGVTVKEVLVTNDKAAKRLVYAVVGGQLTHHSASVEVRPDNAGGSLVIWITDFLPDSFADYIQSQMDAAAAVMKTFLESQRKSDTSQVH